MYGSGIKTKCNSTWDRMVHAPFKKVVAFDLLCIAMGIPIGAGILAAFLFGVEPLKALWGG